MPEWVLKYYRSYTDALSDRAPDKVPVAITCPNCHRRNVELKVTRTLEWTCRAGLMMYQGAKRHLPVAEPEMTSHHVAQLICMDCKFVGELDDEEWVLPNISN